MHNLPSSPPSPPPKGPPPTSPISTNSFSSSSPPQNPTHNQREQNLNELRYLSNLLDITLQRAIEVTNPSPHSLPQILPATLDQVNFHLEFCHCCLETQTLFNVLRDDLNRLKSLVIGPSTLFPSSITTNSS
ncbi:hypothetical protein Tco_0445658 [Tanacetum coccineum]